MPLNGKRTKKINLNFKNSQLLARARAETDKLRKAKQAKIDSELESHGILNLFDKTPLNNSYNSRKQKSRYLITINSNTSTKGKSDLVRAKLGAIKLVRFKEILYNVLNNGSMLKPITTRNKKLNDAYRLNAVGWRPPKLLEFQYHIEKGSKKEFIHAHSYVEFDDLTHIKAGELNLLGKEFFRPEFNNMYINIRHVSDGISNVMEYIKKQNQTTQLN